MKTSFASLFLTTLIILSLTAGCASPQVAPQPTPAQESPVPALPQETPLPGTNYWPAQEWRVSTPEQQGMDSEQLARMFEDIQKNQLNLHSLLIVRNGYLVTEAYFHPYTQDRLQSIASVTKSVISTLVGIAVQKGYIRDTEQTLVSFFPDQTIANLDARKKAITLKDLLTLTAGFTCDDLPWSAGKKMEQSDNWAQFVLGAPMAEQPGTKWNYCGGNVHLLSAILQKTTGMSSRDFANKFLFEPTGMAQVPDNRWPVDPQGITIGPYGLYLTPRDMARLGYLYLQNGRWGDQQILPANWIKEATTPYTTRDSGLGYGYLFTIDPAEKSFSALGMAGQQIYVIPSQSMVIVFTAALPSTKMNEDFFPLKALIDNYILPAVKSEQTLPANPSAAARLNDFIRQAASPKLVTPYIPEGALQWSGLVYQVDPNPYGWETISFAFQPGAETLTVTINGQAIDPQVGLDGVFRIQKGADIFAPEAIRGTWENEDTLSVQTLYLGEFNDTAFRVVFSQEDVNVTAKSVINIQDINLHGKRIHE
jgi:CubicO group peptidase (beta-lactamase class C family)